MLEDCVMEKKNTRSVLPLGRGNGTDPRKNQDGGVGKPFPYSARRRENPGPPAPPKYDRVRKQNPQKGKTYDKRPRPRGTYMASGTTCAEVGQNEAEIGSVISPGSKKHNLNHLLNFHYAPRQSTSHQWRDSGAGTGGYARLFWGGHNHKYNKEQYLQANCQFVVKAGGDYRQYLCNPDQLVDWDLIEQIRILSAEVPSCPICLYPPVAAKMTRCGHIFCWSCILHYLALSDTTWRKCPICYESVHRKDLKSVMAYAGQTHEVGDVITMRLMKRDRGCLQVIPVDQLDHWPKREILSVSENVDTTYSKLLEADLSETMQIVKRERQELEAQLESEKDSNEVCFIESAITLLVEREETIRDAINSNVFSAVQKARLNSESSEDSCGAKPELEEPRKSTEEPYLNAQSFESEFLFLGDANEEMNNDADAEATNRETQESTNTEESSTFDPEDLQPSSSQQPVKAFYFYQAADGQHMYLHGLNARMLELGYGSLDKCPTTITARVVEKEFGTMTTELRRRLRHLQHLPITCPFEVAELHLDAPVIPDFAVEAYKDQLEIRQRKRAKRAQEERRRERKINEEENRKWGRIPTPRIRIGSHVHFPSCGTGTSPPLGEVSKSPSMSSVASSSSLNVSMENLTLTEAVSKSSEAVSGDYGGPSFAQMLRTGSSSQGWGPRPGGPKPPKYSSATGSSAMATPVRQRRLSDSDPEPDGYVPAPAFSQSFMESISHAMAEHARAAVAAQPEEKAKGKKKKQKCKVLFATARACSGK